MYFVGQSLVTGQGRLCFAITDTDPDDADITGVEYDRIEQALLDCPARTRTVVLDCNFAGLAPSAGATYMLMATSANQLAMAAHGPDAATGFTGQLLDIVRAGQPGGPQNLPLSSLYPQLRRQLQARGLPAPGQRSADDADQVAFTRNAAATGSGQPPTSPAGPGPAASPPAAQPTQLALPVTDIDFGPLFLHQRSPERRIRIGKAGGGSLNAQVDASASWLRVSQVDEELVVAIDTSEAGQRQGTITVRTDGGSATVHVKAHVLLAVRTPEVRGIAGQNIAGRASVRPPLSTAKHIGMAFLSVVSLVCLVGFIFVPGVLVATYLGRPLTVRAASRILTGYGAFVFALAILFMGLAESASSSGGVWGFRIFGAIGFVVGLGYLIAGWRMRRFAES